MKKLFSSLFVIALLCFTYTTEAFAVNPDGYVCSHNYHTFGDYVLNGGVGSYGYANRYYWVDSSGFTSAETTYIGSAVDSWIYTTQPIGVTTSISVLKTTTQSSSSFDLYNSYLGTNIPGQTEFWTFSTQHILSNGALTSNYGYSKIYLNEAIMSNDSNQFTSTAAHEFGHALGLSHQNNMTSSIMCQTAYGRTAMRANSTDLNTINHLYA